MCGYYSFNNLLFELNINKILVLMEFLIYYFFTSLICIKLPDLSMVLSGFRAYP